MSAPVSTPLNVAILIFPDVEVLDFAGPFEVFSRTRLTPGVESRRSEDGAPFRVFTVAAKKELLSATGGLQVMPHHSFEDAPAIDIVVIPGGFGTRALLRDQRTLEWIRAVDARTRLTTSVCTGALLLGAAGLLKGLPSTTHWAALDLLAVTDPETRVERERRVVASDRIITSAGVASGMDMAFSVVEQLFGKEVADETAHYIEYRRVSEPQTEMAV